MSIKSNNEISQIISTRLIRKNNNSNKILVMNNSNPRLNDISSNENNSNSNMGNSGNNNNNLNNIKKFDNHKLKALLDDLIQKDLEYDLIIQGYKNENNSLKRGKSSENMTINKNKNYLIKVNKIKSPDRNRIKRNKKN